MPEIRPGGGSVARACRRRRRDQYLWWHRRAGSRGTRAGVESAAHRASSGLLVPTV